MMVQRADIRQRSSAQPGELAAGAFWWAQAILALFLIAVLMGLEQLLDRLFPDQVLDTQWIFTAIVEHAFLVLASVLSFFAGRAGPKVGVVDRSVAWADLSTMLVGVVVALGFLAATAFGILTQNRAFNIALIGLGVFAASLAVMARQQAGAMANAAQDEKAQAERGVLYLLIATAISAHLAWMGQFSFIERAPPTSLGAALTLGGLTLTEASRSTVEWALFLVLTLMNATLLYRFAVRRRAAKVREILVEENRAEELPPQLISGNPVLLEGLIAWLASLLPGGGRRIGGKSPPWAAILFVIVIAGGLGLGIPPLFENADRLCGIGPLMWLCTSVEQGGAGLTMLGGQPFSWSMAPAIVVVPATLAVVASVLALALAPVRRPLVGLSLLLSLVALIAALLVGRSACGPCQTYTAGDRAVCRCAGPDLTACEDGGCKCADPGADLIDCGCVCRGEGVVKDEDGLCRACAVAGEVFDPALASCRPPAASPTSPDGANPFSGEFRTIVLDDWYWLCGNDALVVPDVAANCTARGDVLKSAAFYGARYRAYSTSPLAALVDSDIGDLCDAAAIAAIGSTSSSAEERGLVNRRLLAHRRADELAAALRLRCEQAVPVHPFALTRQGCGPGFDAACPVDDPTHRQLTLITLRRLPAGVALDSAAVQRRVEAYLHGLPDVETGPLLHFGRYGGFRAEIRPLEVNPARPAAR